MLPIKDPNILLSYINTKLRDNYTSLEDLCESLDINRYELQSILSDIGYAYQTKQNQFIITE